MYKPLINILSHNISLLIKSNDISVSIKRDNVKKFEMYEFCGDAVLAKKMTIQTMNFVDSNISMMSKFKEIGASNAMLYQLFEEIELSKMLQFKTAPSSKKAKADIIEAMIYELYISKNKMAAKTLDLLVLILLHATNFLLKKEFQEKSTDCLNELTKEILRIL